MAVAGANHGGASRRRAHRTDITASFGDGKVASTGVVYGGNPLGGWGPLDATATALSPSGGFPGGQWPWTFDPFETHVVVVPGSLVHLDAHTDTRDMGAGLNHGSMFRRAALEVAPAYDPSGHVTALAGATLALDLVHLIVHPDSPGG